jgi:hypothetical protein
MQYLYYILNNNQRNGDKRRVNCEHKGVAQVGQ